MHFQSVTEDLIFPTYLYSFEPSVTLGEISQEILKCQQSEESCSKSNRGGWQSQPHGNRYEETYPKISQLAEECLIFCRDILPNLRDYSCSPENYCWWANVNGYNNCNLLHSHPGALWAAVYYVQIPPDCGPLTLIRTDAHNKIFNVDQLQFSVAPHVGRVFLFPAHILHQVEANLSQENRVSIAMNLS